MSADDLTLRVNGQDYAGWTRVEVTAGIERQARDFKLEITRTWPGATDLPRRVRPGDLCELWVSSEKLLTGFVDATPITYDDLSVQVGVIGRSKTADLVDCAAEFGSGQWRGRKVEQIAADLAGVYGISVKTQVDTGDSVADHQIQPGESAYESIARLLVLRQLLSTDNADGELVLVNPGSDGRAGTALTVSQNILRGSAGLDFKDVFRTYIVSGQRSGSAMDSAQTLAEVSARVTDTAVDRHRTLRITQSGQVDGTACKNRGNYELNYRRARALEATYTVQGWRQQDGRLWLPNQLVRVVDGVIGFDDELLIVEVEYILDDEGTRANLRVGPRAGYVPAPEVVKVAKTKKSSGGGSAGWGDAIRMDFPVKTTK